MPHQIHRLTFIVLVCVLTGAGLLPLRPVPAGAQSPAQSPTQSPNSLPPPHLGYGVHVGPHSSVNPALVDQLRMDWVKLYEPGQIATYSHKRILYRLDLPWPDNWSTFRSSVRQRAAELAALGVDHVGLTPADLGLPGEIDVARARAIRDALVGAARSVALSVATDLPSIISMFDLVGMIRGPILASTEWNGVYWELWGFAILMFFPVCYGISQYSQWLERQLETERR